MNAIDRAKDLVVDILSYSRQHELERTPVQIRRDSGAKSYQF